MKSPDMPKSESHDHDTDDEPAPKFATGAKIELAQRLRRQLERQYLGSSAGPNARFGGPPDDERSAGQ